MKFNSILNNFSDKLETLYEAIVRKLITSFKSLEDELPKGWSDMVGNIAPFGSNWGRGVVGNNGVVIITKGGVKHASLKQKLESGTKMTFYWGYRLDNETLYLETASIRGDGFNRKNVPVIVSAILDKTRYSWKVPSKNIIFENSIFDYEQNL